ncbi:MAG: YIP1 family protein [Anaerolineae bacterium]|nr:YIP1 family protein [Anaerolineae bacterium]
MKESFVIAWNALFLKAAPYHQLRDSEKPFLDGLKLLLIIAAAVGIARAVGGILNWGISPSPDDVREIIQETIKEQGWYAESSGAVEDYDSVFNEQFDMIFTGISMITFSTVGGSLLNVITTPVTALLVWLGWGLLGHLFARIFGGDASFKQTYGVTALAISPMLINLTALIPGVQVGWLVFIWTMSCRYVAIKSGHHIKWGRALTATLLPYVVIGLLMAVAGGVGMAVFIQGVSS